MANALGVSLYEVLSNRSRVIRYVSCIRRTLSALRRLKPEIVICQNPSLVLTILLLQLRKPFQFKLTIDAHFGAVEAFNGSRLLQRILDYCNRKAELVIVTTEAHSHRVRSLGGKSIVCPDPLPDLSKFLSLDKEVSRKVFFICSFDVDEPFGEVFRAAELLAPEGFRFVVSGNYKKAGISPESYPDVELVGFVPEEEFYKHLFTSQVAIDLTEWEDCLVCGAYEAIAAGKPIVLSKSRALQAYFTGGAVFTDNRATEICAAVRLAHAERLALVEQGRQWALKAREEIDVHICSLRRALTGL